MAALMSAMPMLGKLGTPAKAERMCSASFRGAAARLLRAPRRATPAAAPVARAVSTEVRRTTRCSCEKR